MAQKGRQMAGPGWGVVVARVGVAAFRGKVFTSIYLKPYIKSHIKIEKEVLTALRAPRPAAGSGSL